MADDAAAAAYRATKQEEYERRILQQIRERPSNIMRIRTFEEAKDRWRAPTGRAKASRSASTTRRRALRKHVLGLNRIREKRSRATSAGKHRAAHQTLDAERRQPRRAVARPAATAQQRRRVCNMPELLRETPMTLCGHEFCALRLEAALFEVLEASDVSRDCQMATGSWLSSRLGPSPARPAAFAPAGNGSNRSRRRHPHARLPLQPQPERVYRDDKKASAPRH